MGEFKKEDLDTASAFVYGLKKEHPSKGVEKLWVQKESYKGSSYVVRYLEGGVSRGWELQSGTRQSSDIYSILEDCILYEYKVFKFPSEKELFRWLSED